MSSTRQPTPAKPRASVRKLPAFGACVLTGKARGVRGEQRNSQSAQRNYQHYMELARAESASGNTVAAETYYQYAEHYFRTMNSSQETT